MPRVQRDHPRGGTQMPRVHERGLNR
jgi:hypothetical protein